MISPLATIREGLSKGHELGYRTDKEAFTTNKEENVTNVAAIVAKHLFEFLENNHGAITPDLFYLIRKRYAIEAQQANTFREIVFANLQFFFSKPIPFEQGNPIYPQIGRSERDFPRTIAQNATPDYWAGIVPDPEKWNKYSVTFKYKHTAFYLTISLRELPLQELKKRVVRGQYSHVAPYIETAFMRYSNLRSSILQLPLPERSLFTKSINDWWRIHRHGDEELQKQLVHLQALIEKKLFIKEPSNVIGSVYKRFCEEYERLKSGKTTHVGTKETDEHKAAYYRSLYELRERAIATFTENFMAAREVLLKKEEFVLKAFTDLKYLKDGQTTRLGILKLLEHDGYIKRKEK